MASESLLVKRLLSMSRGDPSQRISRVPGVVLGKGTFGQVFKAIDKVTEETVAVKKMEYNKDHLKLMLAEVSHLEMCGDHPNVTGFRGLYHRPSCLLLAMEYIDGLNAFELCNHNPLKAPHIALITRELMQGLDYIHTKLQLLHHDIKMQNIMISRDGAVKIADFGLSMKAGDQKTVLVGTPRYTAPEVLRSKDYTCSIDIWAAGICVYAMAELELPYPDIAERSVDRIIYYNKHTPRLSSSHPIPMQQFVAACLQERESRPQASVLLGHRWLRTACPRAELADLVTVTKNQIQEM